MLFTNFIFIYHMVFLSIAHWRFVFSKNDTAYRVWDVFHVLLVWVVLSCSVIVPKKQKSRQILKTVGFSSLEAQFSNYLTIYDKIILSVL